MEISELRLRIKGAQLENDNSEILVTRAASAHCRRRGLLLEKEKLLDVPAFARLPGALGVIVLAMPSFDPEFSQAILELCGRIPEIESLSDFRVESAVLCEYEMDGFPLEAQAIIRAWPKLPLCLRNLLLVFSQRFDVA